MDELGKDIMKAYKASVGHAKATTARIENAYKDIDNDYAAIDEYTRIGKDAPDELLQKREYDCNKLKGLLFELGADAIKDYNNLGGKPQRKVV